MLAICYGRARSKALILAFLSAFAILLTVCPVNAETVVNFPDPGLEAAIRDAIGKPSGDILDTDLIGLTNLSAHHLMISDLTGIEYCTDLVTLYIQNNQISDLTPLSGLTDLMYLNLSNNQITSISALSSLTGLIQLYIYTNSISDVTALSGMNSLTFLNISGNNVTNLNPITSLPNLGTVVLTSNGITNISPLVVMTPLVQLYLDYNPVADFTPLSSMPQLQSLCLNSTQIADLTPISGLTNLTLLMLNFNPISDVSPLTGLSSLTSLYLSRNDITDASPLAALTGLTHLDLGENQVTDITGFDALINITNLDLASNYIAGIQPLSDNTGLGTNDEVDLTGNPLSNDALWVQIPVLEGRGADVSYDPIIPWEPLALHDEFLHFRSALGQGVTWSLAQSPSGGTVDAATGVYEAGTGGNTDRIRVENGISVEMDVNVLSTRSAGVCGPFTSMDVDGGGLRLSDVILMLKYVVAVDTPTPAETFAADFNCNASVDLADVINALRVVVGLVPLL